MFAVLCKTLVGSVALIVCALAWAAPPEHRLSRSEQALDLTALMATDAVPADWLQDPQALWALPAHPPAARSWTLDGSRRMVGRITLHGSRERDDYVVVLPNARIDEVQIWYRSHQSEDWKGALAGDRIPLSRWPFVAPFPAFPLAMDETPMDLIVTAVNEGPLTVPVLIHPDPAYREAQTRQAQVSGLVAGLGVMVVVVCLISAIALSRRSNLLLAAFAAWALLTLMSFSGDLAIWLTPDWPAVNNGSKHFTVVVMSALLVTVTAAALDERLLTRMERRLAWIAPAVAMVYAALQVTTLPAGWRPAGGYGSAALGILIAFAMCGMSQLKGGRNVALVASAVLCYVAAIVIQSLPFGLVGGLDLRSAGTAAALFAGVLLLRYAVYRRERYGRDVLGREAIGARRDPLTALLSYTGFQDAYEAHVLRHKAGHGVSAAMLFLLPGLERSTADHGFEVVERALVRFAACLQRVLGSSWTLARLSKRRFAAISLAPVAPEGLQAAATLVLAEGARLTEPLAAIGDFDLKIAATNCRTSADLRVLLTELELAATAMEDGKRIVIF